MIVRPNAESAIPSKQSSDALNGHMMKMDKTFAAEVENSAASVNCGRGCSGFGFDTAADGTNKTPKSDQTIDGYFGNGGS